MNFFESLNSFITKTFINKILGNVQCHKAFSLVEILMTLAVIGIIAAFTLPQIKNYFQVQSTVIALKKAQSVLSSAYMSAIQENGPIETWGATTDDGANSALLLNKIIPYLSIRRNCENSTWPHSCFATVYALNGTVLAYPPASGITARAELNNGSLISLDLYNHPVTQWPTNSGYRAVIYYDLNGYKKPNIAGKDIFTFWIYNDKIIPVGFAKDTNYPFTTNCIMNTGTGRGCTAWVIYNQNMDYLNCTGLNWSGNNTCN